MITSKFKTFKLLIDNILVSECGYNIEDADEFFNEKYISIYNLKTIEQAINFLMVFYFIYTI